MHTGSLQFDDIFEQCCKAVLPGHALLLAMHIINHTSDVDIKDEKVCTYIYIYIYICTHIYHYVSICINMHYVCRMRLVVMVGRQYQ